MYADRPDFKFPAGDTYLLIFDRKLSPSHGVKSHSVPAQGNCVCLLWKRVVPFATPWEQKSLVIWNWWIYLSVHFMGIQCLKGKNQKPCFASNEAVKKLLLVEKLWLLSRHCLGILFITLVRAVKRGNVMRVFMSFHSLCTLYVHAGVHLSFCWLFFIVCTLLCRATVKDALYYVNMSLGLIFSHVSVNPVPGFSVTIPDYLFQI